MCEINLGPRNDLSEFQLLEAPAAGSLLLGHSSLWAGLRHSGWEWLRCYLVGTHFSGIWSKHVVGGARSRRRFMYCIISEEASST